MRLVSVGEKRTAASSSITGSSPEAEPAGSVRSARSAAAASSSESWIGTTRSSPTFSITSRQNEDGREMTSLPPCPARTFDALMIAPRAVELMNLTSRRFSTAWTMPPCMSASISSWRLRT